MARFTAANAREMAAKSHAAKAAAMERLRQAANPPLPEPLDAYLSKRLSRVRAQIELVDQAIEAEGTKSSPDGQRLDRLANALYRLSELERVLAGRPLPGNLRPSAAASRRGSAIDYGSIFKAPPAPPGPPVAQAEPLAPATPPANPFSRAGPSASETSPTPSQSQGEPERASSSPTPATVPPPQPPTTVPPAPPPPTTRRVVHDVGIAQRSPLTQHAPPPKRWVSGKLV